MRLLPDKLLVFNEVVRQEAIKHADMPEDKIEIVGLPQYDQFVTDMPISREEFCRGAGLDPNRKIVLAAPKAAYRFQAMLYRLKANWQSA